MFNSRCPVHQRRCKCALRHDTKRNDVRQKINHAVQAGSPSTSSSTSSPESEVIIYSQPAKLDPFDALPAHNTRVTASQELLHWYTYNPSRTDIVWGPVWRSFWELAKTNAAFYHSFAAVVNAPFPETSNTSIAKQRQRTTKFLEHRSLGLHFLRLALGRNEFVDQNSSAITLTVIFHLHFSYRDENATFEKAAHMKALERMTKLRSPAHMAVVYWFNFSLLTLKLAQWDLCQPVVQYAIHPACRFDQLLQAGALDKRVAWYQTRKATVFLPVLEQPYFDVVACFSVFHRMFLHTHLVQSPDSKIPALGVFYSLAYDLRVYASQIKVLIAGTEESEDLAHMCAVYIMLLASELSTWALHNETTSSRGHATTNTASIIAQEILRALQLAKISAKSWTDYCEPEVLIWVLFLAITHFDHPQSSVQNEDLTFLQTCFQNSLEILRIDDQPRLREVLQLFPWFAGWSDERLERIWRELNTQNGLRITKCPD